MTSDRMISLIAGALALASLALWLTADSAAPVPVQAKDEEMERLAARLDEAQTRLRELSVRPATVTREAAAIVPGVADDRVEARIRSLKQQVDDLETALAEWMRNAEQSGNERRPRGREDSELARTEMAAEALARYQATFLDRDEDLYQRLTVLKALRDFPPEMAPFEPLIDEILYLLENAPEGRARESVVDGVDEIRDERVVTALLRLVEGNTSENLRYEAVKALGKNLDRPDVRQVLSRIASGPEGRVQAAAQRSLERADR